MLAVTAHCRVALYIIFVHGMQLVFPAVCILSLTTSTLDRSRESRWRHHCACCIRACARLVRCPVHYLARRFSPEQSRCAPPRPATYFSSTPSGPLSCDLLPSLFVSRLHSRLSMLMMPLLLLLFPSSLSTYSFSSLSLFFFFSLSLSHCVAISIPTMSNALSYTELVRLCPSMGARL